MISPITLDNFVGQHAPTIQYGAHTGEALESMQKKNKGFTLIEMLTTSAILVLAFGLLSVIFGRANTIHKVVRSGGDAENLGIYLMNTITYGPGIDREKGLVGAQSVTSLTGACSSNVLSFTNTKGQEVQYTFGDVTGDSKTLLYGSLTGIDLKPTWAKDRQMEVLPAPYSGFSYYKSDKVTEAAGSDTAFVGIKLALKNTLQSTKEALTLYQCVRIRNQVDF